MGVVVDIGAARTLCVECGPGVKIDEDGCCAVCGTAACGTWLTTLVAGDPELPLREAVATFLAEFDCYAYAIEGTGWFANGPSAWVKMVEAADRLRAAVKVS